MEPERSRAGMRHKCFPDPWACVEMGFETAKSARHNQAFDFAVDYRFWVCSSGWSSQG